MASVTYYTPYNTTLYNVIAPPVPPTSHAGACNSALSSSVAPAFSHAIMELETIAAELETLVEKGGKLTHSTKKKVQELHQKSWNLWLSSTDRELYPRIAKAVKQLFPQGE